MQIKLNNSNIELYSPSIEYFVDKLRSDTNFSFAKLNHSFWDMVSGNSYWKKMFETVHQDDIFLKENINSLVELPDSENFMLGVSNCGPPEVALGCYESIYYLEQFINTRKNLFYGQLWKHYCRTGDIKKLIYAIRDKNVVVVGLKHLSDLANCWGIKKFNHLKIDLTVTKERFNVLDELRQYKNSIILFQCGEMLSLWFIKSLHNNNNNNTMIDMGRSLDLFCTMNDIDQEVVSVWPDIKSQKWIIDFKMHNIKSFEQVIVIGKKISIETIDYILTANGLQKLHVLYNPEYINFFPMTCVLFINTVPKNNMNMPYFCLNYKTLKIL